VERTHEELVAAAVEAVATWRNLNPGALHVGQTESQRLVAEEQLQAMADRMETLADALTACEKEEG